MAKDVAHQTNYTRKVHLLLARVYGQSKTQDSLLDSAVDYFTQNNFRASDEEMSADDHQIMQMECDKRHARLLSLALSICDLVEGDEFSENNRKSAQCLGTIQLLNPTEGKRVARTNEQSKAVYKAVLCLRLLDNLILSGQMKDPYINKYLEDISLKQYLAFSSHNPQAAKRFTDQVKVPLIIAALLQDIGNYHPKAQIILCGEDGQLDPFRVLDSSQRKKLLQINHIETLRYLIEGIGIPSYIGNSKTERDQFLLDEQDKLSFIKRLLKTSVNPKSSIGNILKVPQIYISIILSTKENYNYKVLPQVFQVLNKNAELGACDQRVIDALYKITGMFPQGFGLVYMPNGEFVNSGDSYEYAIVNGLYPKDPEEPFCRMATRKLSFIGHGQNIVLTKDKNLYFPETAKKMARVSKERLGEILTLLSSNSQERQKLDLLPRCWHADEYFSIKTNQNLWNNID